MKNHQQPTQAVPINQRQLRSTHAASDDQGASVQSHLPKHGAHEEQKTWRQESDERNSMSEREEEVDEMSVIRRDPASVCPNTTR